jgi:hypothetical protein
VTRPAPATGLAALAALAALENRDSHLFRRLKIGDCPYFCGALLIAAAAMALADAAAPAQPAAHATTAAAAAARPAAPSAAPSAATAAESAAARCLYLPPEFAPHVVFYHTFDDGPDRPEINRLGAKVQAAAAAPAGLTGRGIDGSLRLGGLAIGLGRPITVSLWWRLNEPLKVDGGFGLLALNGRGWVSNFVRSGPWCGLKEPHFVTQVYNWPNVSNVNGVGDAARVREGAWHHAALVVSAASRVQVYWDGALRSDFHVNGRPFGAGDVIQSMHLGQDGPSRPMTIDEVLVLDAALGADAVRDYASGVRQLAAVGFPRAAARPE